MSPDLEVVQIRRGESFKAWSHGYPYHTVRWHFHPEYELHFVCATSGKYFVGDFIGDFQSGNLVLTGPNLPHNWVSAVQKDEIIPLRCRIIQFSELFIDNAIQVFPEFCELEGLLEKSRRGVLFSARTARAVDSLIEQIVGAQGATRVELFISIVAKLCRDRDAKSLASADYRPDPSGYMSVGINKALSYIRENLTDEFSERDLALISGQSTASFSRAFRRHTGLSLMQYVRRLRVNLACQLLMTEEKLSVTDICYEVGFNNVSNFNRQFLAEKGMPPSRFRRLFVDNLTTAAA
jgi:AraC-like DNA-binding protein